MTKRFMSPRKKVVSSQVRILSWLQKLKNIKIMVIMLVQFGLMGLNLYGAKKQQDNGRNPAFSYFVAGICCMGGLYGLIKLIS